MLLIGRAQGIIMKERGLPPTEALLELCVQSARNQISLAGGALRIVEDPSSESLPAPNDAAADPEAPDSHDAKGVAKSTLAAVDASEDDAAAGHIQPPRDA